MTTNRPNVPANMILVWALAFSAILASCSSPEDMRTGPDIDTIEESSSLAPVTPTTTTTPSPSATSAEASASFATTHPEIKDLPVGSHTCGELQGSVPSGVDDFGFDLVTGLLTYRWGANHSATLQVFDDITCEPGTDAWTFLIAPVLTRESFDRSAQTCVLLNTLTSEHQPANAEIVLDHLGGRTDLIRNCQ